MTKNKLSNDADPNLYFGELCFQMGMFLIHFSRAECIVGKYATSLSVGKFHPSDEELLDVHALSGFKQKTDKWLDAVKKAVENGLLSHSALEQTKDLIEIMDALRIERNRIAHALMVPQDEGWIEMHWIEPRKGPRKEVVSKPLTLDDLRELNRRTQAIVDVLASKDNPITQRPPIKPKKL